MSQAIKYAKLNADNAHLPGLGSLGKTLPPVSRTFSEFSMTSSDPGICVKAKTLQGASYSFIVPWAQVDIAEFSGDAFTSRA